MNPQTNALLEAPLLAPVASAHFNRSFWSELTALAADVAAVLRDDLVAVVLGGGYGRSEGCVTLLDGCEFPYNDVDLFLVTTTALPLNYPRLRDVAAHYHQRLHIEIDFSRPQTLGMIARWPALLMWQELAIGHHVLYGSSDVITAHVPNRVLQRLPIVEASRLLLNRGAGLAWAARVAAGLDTPPDSTFVARNYFKCAQALADAALIADGRYASDPETKRLRLAEFADDDSVIANSDAVRHFDAATAFRRHPHRHPAIGMADLRALASDWLTMFLWVESKRHDRDFDSATGYAAWSGPREPRDASLFRHIAANLRARRFGWRHPRERVFRGLPLALDCLARCSSDFPATSRVALADWRSAQ